MTTRSGKTSLGLALLGGAIGILLAATMLPALVQSAESALPPRPTVRPTRTATPATPAPPTATRVHQLPAPPEPSTTPTVSPTALPPALPVAGGEPFPPAWLLPGVGLIVLVIALGLAARQRAGRLRR